ncbi:hypothetical protein FNS47_22585, partial [Salmonella enterica]|nr:hypothetical protein [Salmonella enterica]
KKEFLPFFAVFISYLFYLNVFSKFIREKKPNILIRSIYLYILLTVIPFFAIASSLRQYLAFSIILYIIITYCSKQDRRTFLISFPLVVMAIGIHPSVILLIALFLFSRFIRLNRIVVLLIFFILVLNFNGYISIQLFKLFKPLLMNTGFYYPEYMDADVIHMNNQLLSTNEFILNKLILPSIFYLLIPVFLIFYKKSNSKQEKQLKNYCALLLLTICLLSLSPDLFYRFSIFWTLFYSYIYFTYDSERMSLPAKQCYLVIIIVASCVINLAQANMGKKIIYNSWGSFFYQPSLFVFVKEIKTTDYINVSQ